jgi:biotin carboxyl carrier protein
MTIEEPQNNSGPESTVNSFESMRQFSGSPAEFWPAFLELTVLLAKDELGRLLVRDKAQYAWKNVSTWPANATEQVQSKNSKQIIEEVAESSLSEKCSWQNEIPTEKGTPELVILGVSLDLNEPDRQCVAIFLLKKSSDFEIESVATSLKLVADTPALYQRGRLAHQALHDVTQFSEALDLMILFNKETKYMAVAMTLCNEIAARYRSTRVSLGWLEGKYVRLQAISHMERFEKKMDVVQNLEAAMEEAFDQNEEIVWPQHDSSTSVTRDHEAFIQEQGVQFMVSLPIRLDDEVAGVLSCERQEEAYSEIEVRGLRVLCDQSARRLGELKERDRWFGARLLAWTKDGLAKLLGVEHTFAKAMGILGCLVLAFLLFGRLPFRVDAPFILRSDNVKYLPAPFDGYINTVLVEVGDSVEEGDLLLTLDTRELLLEESSAIANENRYTREAEKARAENALADMKIALSMAAQAKARLEQVRYHLGNAEVEAPYKGIVVEGELEELFGAPVKKGDILFKVAKIEQMYVELKVDERDIHEIIAGDKAEMAFVSQPQLKFPILVERIDPVAISDEEGNIFITRCQFTEGAADWWRPGMSGITKIDVGKRNVLWILTHRTIDFFRMLLWW